jgi:hypothetical protein
MTTELTSYMQTSIFITSELRSADFRVVYTVRAEILTDANQH